MVKLRFGSLAVCLVATACKNAPQQPVVSEELSLCSVDVHQHFASNVPFDTAARAMLEAMDAIGIRTALVMPPPQEAESIASSGAHYEYFDPSAGGGPSLLDMVRDNPDRFALVAGGGLLNSAAHEAVLSGEDATTAQLDQLQIDAEAMLADGAKGFGELSGLHFSLEETHPFLSIPADHPMFLRLATVAAEHGVPIDIHLETVARASIDVPADFLPTTPNGAPCFLAPNNNPDTVSNNVQGFENLLEHSHAAACAAGDCDKARVIWSHIGWDNVGDLDVDLIARLIEAHPNLYLSLKLLDQPSFCQLGDNRPLADTDGDGTYDTMLASWASLIAENPQRFVLGADEFFADGSDTIGTSSTNGTWTLLAHLPADAQRAVACDNPRRLYNLP